MKKLLYVVLGVIFLLIVSALVLPSLVDPNQYKTEIETKFEQSTGYALDINGDISLSAFPVIKAKIGNVAISNNSRNLANIGEIIAYPKLIPLLSGKVKIDSIKIQEPKISLETTEEGNSWDKIEGAEPKQPPMPNTGDTEKKQLDLAIDSIEIVDDVITFDDQVKQKNYSLTDINIDSSLGSMKGPLSFDATLKYNNMPVSAKGSVDNFESPKIAFTSNLMGSEVAYQGALAGGKLIIKSQDIGPVADFLGIKGTEQYAKLPVDITADVNYTKEKADLQNIKILFGDTNGTGNVTASLTGDMVADVNMKFSTINLDQLMPKGKKTTDPTEAKKKVAAGDAKKPMAIKLNMTADKIIYGGQNYNNLLINSEVENGLVVVQPVNLGLPGGGKLEVYGIMSTDTLGRSFDGQIIMNADNFREVLKSFKITPDVKAGALTKMSFNSNVVVNMRNNVTADLSDTTVRIDDTQFKGSVSVDMNTRPVVAISGTINQLDINKYMSATKKAPVQTKQSGGVGKEEPIQFTWLEKLPLEGNVNLSVGSLTFKDDTYSNIRLRSEFKPGALNFAEITAASKKLQLSGKGWISSATGQKPKVNIQANIGRINLADFISKDPAADAKQATAPKPANKSRWSQEPYDLSFLRKIEVDFKANIAALVHNQITLDNLAIAGSIKDDKLVVTEAQAGLFGGNINMTANVAATAVPSISLAMNGSNVDVYKALVALADNERVQGKLTFKANISSAGIHQLAMISNLAGGVSLSSSELIVKGFDLKGLATQITNINDISGVIGIARTLSGENAVTYINAVNGGVIIENGVVSTQGEGLVMEVSGAGRGNFTGKADLVNWNMDSNATFNLVTPDQKERPGVGIHIYGPLDSPNKNINLDEVKRYVAERATKLLLKKGIISEKNAELLQPGGLENRANEEITKGLGKLLGGKVKAPAAPAAAVEAPVEPAPAAPVPEAAPAPETSPEVAPEVQ